MSFTLGDFWALIDLARSRAEVDLSLEPEVIAAILVERSTDERRSFNEHVEALQLRSHHWNTLGPALIIGCGESDEGYLDFRLWLISLGKEGYERTLVEPDWLADLPVDDPRSEWHFGALHSVAGAANAEAGEGELDFYPTEHAPMNGVPCGTDDVSLARRFPRLWERFGTPDADQADARACVSGG